MMYPTNARGSGTTDTVEYERRKMFQKKNSNQISKVISACHSTNKYFVYRTQHTQSLSYNCIVVTVKELPNPKIIGHKLFAH